MVEKSPANTALIVVAAGVLLGVSFFGNMLFAKDSITANGAGVTSFFKQTGFIGGLFVAILFWGEKLSAFQWTGIIFILFALVMMIGDFKSLNIHSPKLLLTLLLSGTLVEANNKFFSQYALDQYNTLFLSIAFLVVLVVCTLYVTVLGKKGETSAPITLREILYGGVLGISNTLNNYFKLLSLKTLPTALVIPTIAAGSLVMVTLIGIVFYKEKTNTQHLAALGVTIVGIVLLNG